MHYVRLLARLRHFLLPELRPAPLLYAASEFDLPGAVDPLQAFADRRSLGLQVEVRPSAAPAVSCSRFPLE
jgi:hypothetical protein